MIKKIDISPLYIKEFVEEKTGLKLDTKSRKRKIAEIRFVCFKLTKELTKNTLSSIGEPYKRDHASVLHGIKQFDDLSNQYDFEESKKLYEYCLNEFIKSSENPKFNELKRLYTIREIKSEYLDRYNKISKQYRKVIANQRRVIENLSERTIMSEIANLDDASYNELKPRIEAFLVMNNKK